MISLVLNNVKQYESKSSQKAELTAYSNTNLYQSSRRSTEQPQYKARPSESSRELEGALPPSSNVALSQTKLPTRLQDKPVR